MNQEDEEVAHSISPNKRWIKKISKDEPVFFANYSRKDSFHLVANVEQDKNTKRNTVIRFETVISKEELESKSEWLYLITINDIIVKIGGTRTGLKGRFSSYITGHHTKERGKTGDCSKTNAFIYNTLDFYIQLGYEVKVYGYKIPKVALVIDVLGENVEISPQTYHIYESKFLEDYRKTYKKYPQLSSNCDPEYKK
jgi:hypothetical protein